MRLIFVRHGEPDYVKDCLTDTGRLQAEAASERLLREGISKIYASPCGRAQETASYTAEKLGLPILTLDYMREICWGFKGVTPLYKSGHPWTLALRMAEEENLSLTETLWTEHPFFSNNAATDCDRMIEERIDGFLEELGYRREENRYLCVSDDTDKTVALFSHGGSGACALSRMLNLPFPYLAAVMPYGFTSITILSFPNGKGSHVIPRLELFNDMSHTLAIRREGVPEFGA